MAQEPLILFLVEYGSLPTPIEITPIVVVKSSPEGYYANDLEEPV